ncbi:hypothetical protein AMTRI_Chr05g68690 [Amborella trichopoda]
MASTTSDLIWLKSFLNDLGFKSANPIPLFCDNQAAIHIATNPLFHEITKHIEVDCHFIKEKVQAKTICTPNVVAIDINKDVHEEHGMPIIKKAGVAHKISFIHSPAMPILDELLQNVRSLSLSQLSTSNGTYHTNSPRRKGPSTLHMWMLIRPIMRITMIDS